jgi:hypothetical protein
VPDVVEIYFLVLEADQCEAECGVASEDGVGHRLIRQCVLVALRLDELDTSSIWTSNECLGNSSTVAPESQSEVVGASGDLFYLDKDPCRFVVAGHDLWYNCFPSEAKVGQCPWEKAKPAEKAPCYSLGI